MARRLLSPWLRRLLPAIHCMGIPLMLEAAGPSPNASARIKERVDLIELNHFFDEHGKHLFDQVIFYEWAHDYQRFHVIAWSLVEGDTSRSPSKLPGSGDTVVRWFDRDAKVRRQIQARLFRETWSQVDPERENRQWIDEKHRLSLQRSPSRMVR